LVAHHAVRLVVGTEAQRHIRANSSENTPKTPLVNAPASTPMRSSAAN
jgi:hypothetical protein